MRMNGEWMTCEDGVVRPILRAEVLTGSGVWRSFDLLIDTGADRTVICKSIMDDLQLPSVTSDNQIGGLGGIAKAESVSTTIRLFREDGENALFRSVYIACIDHEALDMSVLGRDILDLFALVADRSANVLAILRGKHRCSIQSG